LYTKARKPIIYCTKLTTRTTIFSFLLISGLSLFSGLTLPAQAVEDPENIPKTTEITEHLGETIDLSSLVFTKEDGQNKTLAEIAPFQRPFIIVPVYYNCPRLCSLTLNSLQDSLKDVDLTLGEDYSIITVSFNHEEGPKLAMAKGSAYHKSFNPELANFDSWPFLTGTKESHKTQRLKACLSRGL